MVGYVGHYIRIKEKNNTGHMHQPIKRWEKNDWNKYELVENKYKLKPEAVPSFHEISPSPNHS